MILNWVELGQRRDKKYIFFSNPGISEYDKTLTTSLYVMLHGLFQAKNKFNFDVTIKDTLGINQNKMKNMDNKKDKRLYKTCEE